MRHWANVELTKENAFKFKEFCRDNGLRYETSEAGNLIHFEVNVTANEEREANRFLLVYCA